MCPLRSINLVSGWMEVGCTRQKKELLYWSWSRSTATEGCFSMWTLNFFKGSPQMTRRAGLQWICSSSEKPWTWQDQGMDRQSTSNWKAEFCRAGAVLVLGPWEGRTKTTEWSFCENRCGVSSNEFYSRTIETWSVDCLWFLSHACACWDAVERVPALDRRFDKMVSRVPFNTENPDFWKGRSAFILIWWLNLKDHCRAKNYRCMCYEG